MADVFKPTFRCRDPMTVSPRWVLADVLLVAALKRGHPIQLFIQVKTDNFSRKTLKLPLWFHDLLSGRGFHVNTLTRNSAVLQNFAASAHSSSEKTRLVLLGAQPRKYPARCATIAAVGVLLILAGSVARGD